MHLIASPFRWIKNWLNPTDSDPRSRILRYLIAVLFISGLAGTTLFRVAFHDPGLPELFWGLISLFPNSERVLGHVREPILSTGIGLFHESIYNRLLYLSWPLLHVLVIISALLGGWQLHQRQFNKAAYIIVFQFMVIIAWLILFVSDLVIPGAMSILLVAGILLSTRSTWIVWSLVIVFSFGIAQLRQTLTTDTAWAGINIPRLYVFITIETVLLYAFRVEFDARVNAWEKARRAELEQERLRELDKQKTQFLNSMSHELRTPLHSIIGLSTSILHGVAGDIDEELYVDIETIGNSGKHLLNLVNELLDLAKLESGSIKLDKKRFDIAAVINATLRIVQSQTEDKGLTLINSVTPQLPFVYADPQATQQIVLNLLTNAIKFTSQGSIEINTELKQNELIVRVKDSGVGISAEHQKYIFDRFYQVSGLYKKSEIGLGLTISKSLVELQGGTMWVESVLNEGAAFFFSLPTS